MSSANRKGGGGEKQQQKKVASAKVQTKGLGEKKANADDIYKRMESSKLFSCVDLWRNKVYVNETRLLSVLEEAEVTAPLTAVIGSGNAGSSGGGTASASELAAELVKALREVGMAQVRFPTLVFELSY